MKRLLLATLPLLVTSCGDAPAPPRNLLVITIDTLRADHLGCYGYNPYTEPVSPEIDALARAGLRFTHCFAPRGQTAPSLGSLMTGLYPSRHGVRENGQPFVPGVRTLAEHLDAHGYETAAFGGFVPGAPDGRATKGFASIVIGRQLCHSKGSQSDWDEAAERAATGFLAARQSAAKRGAGNTAAKPFFAWVHFYDVHQPYAPPAPDDRRFTGDYAGPLRLPSPVTEEAFTSRVEAALDQQMVARAPPDRADRDYAIGLYDGGIRATDARVGRIRRALAEAGLAEETLVVLSADHGDELAQHNQFWFHGNSVYDDVLHIPLLIAGPGIAPGTCDDLVQNVDLLPSLLDLLALPDGGDVDGISFASVLAPGRSRSERKRDIAWSEWQDLILGARTAEWKLIANPRGAHPKKPPYQSHPEDDGYLVDCYELYDLRADPGETKNLYDERKNEVEALRLQVAQEYARRFAGSTWTPSAAPEDPGDREHLAKLGYPAADDRRADVVLHPEACRDR